VNVTLLTVAFDTLQVAQPMAPAAFIVTGEVPLNPALPTLAIGMAVGRSPAAMVPHAGEAEIVPLPVWVRKFLVAEVFPASLVLAGVAFS